MATRVQQRRGNASEWTQANPILAQGEIGVELDTLKFKVGDGVKDWKSLPYATGVQGEEGKSAFQVWQTLPGNEGKTVQEFFGSFKGETGPQGDPGPKGDIGLAGETGPAGP